MSARADRRLVVLDVRATAAGWPAGKTLGDLREDYAHGRITLGEYEHGVARLLRQPTLTPRKANAWDKGNDWCWKVIDDIAAGVTRGGRLLATPLGFLFCVLYLVGLLVLFTHVG